MADDDKDKGTTVLDKKKSNAAVRPFTIEADHHSNSDLLLQGIPGAKRLRSALKANRTVRDSKSGELRMPQDRSRHLSMLPELPGMQLHVNPGTLVYRITDPLSEDKPLRERLQKALRESTPFRVSNEIKGVPTQKGVLDTHRMKTLVREMLWLVESGDAKVVEGNLPSIEDIDDLPGKYLLNPGSRTPLTQPMYEEDFESWVSQLTKAGG